MIKLTITKIGIPKEIQTSRGPATTNYIKATEYGDKFLNYFVGKTTENWKVGQIVEVDTVEEREYKANDGAFKVSYNIRMPKFGNNSDVMKALEEIRGQLAKVLLGQRELFEAFSNPKKPYPNMEEETGLKEGEAHPFDDDPEGLNQINVDEFQGM